ncbi:MAG TPA: hypothetical protein VHQ42_06185 [Candidatus Limnocylindria bacterium]|nr:hypothetical protein [Candidatus Limnocylindria bacterium]
MARRAGKAANRKARQRKVARTQSAPSVARPTEPSIPPIGDVPAGATPVPPVGTPDAREAASLTPPRRTASPIAARGGSELTAREQGEYHYVERDLRDIGILTAAMAALLLVAWIAFRALGVGT